MARSNRWPSRGSLRRGTAWLASAPEAGTVWVYARDEDEASLEAQAKFIAQGVRIAFEEIEVRQATTVVVNGGHDGKD